MRQTGNNLVAQIRLLIITAILFGACTAAPTETPAPTPDSKEFVFGLVLVGSRNDRGWSEAHYTGGLYVEANLPDSRMIFLDSLNPSDRPETTLEQAVDDMVAERARLIFITSDDFAADTSLVATKYPEIIFIHISGDHVLAGTAPPNLSNYMGQMEFGKMIAGCAAALTTETGVIGYLGPLINHETRRLVNAAYLGARYCYEHYGDQNPEDLRFLVEWIGFWFHIPEVTADPTEVANDMFDQGVDVLLSGIDTTEGLVVTTDRAVAGERVWAVHYDYEDACNEAAEVCLGVPYFNWGPGYLELARQVLEGRWIQQWQWAEPDWKDLNNHDTSAIGFLKGPALTVGQAAQLDRFIADLADGSINLFKGPLNFQDGLLFLTEGETASDTQIWYMPQLLTGMEGLSE